jgi:hypothetical protein
MTRILFGGFAIVLCGVLMTIPMNSRELSDAEMERCLGGDECETFSNQSCMVFEGLCTPDISDCNVFGWMNCSGDNWVPASGAEKKFCAGPNPGHSCTNCSPTGYCKSKVTCYWDYLDGQGCLNGNVISKLGGTCTST